MFYLARRIRRLSQSALASLVLASGTLTLGLPTAANEVMQPILRFLRFLRENKITPARENPCKSVPSVGRLNFSARPAPPLEGRCERTSVATATRYDSVACDKGEVYLPQRSVL